MPPYRVEYYCPRQSPYWQGPRNQAAIYDLSQAIGIANMLKPNSPQGHARVVDVAGNVVYQI